MELLRRSKSLSPVWLAGLFLVASVLFHHKVLAGQGQIFSGPVSAGMGGGGRAGADVTELVFLNPAVAALAVGFEADGFYRDGAWQDHQGETDFGASFIENNPENFAPGGFAYLQKRRNLPGLAWTEQLVHGVLAQSLSPHFTFGLSAYYLTQKTDAGAAFTQWNGSVGALITNGPSFGVAVVYANPIQPGGTIPLALKQVPQLSLGINWTVPDLIRVTFDVTRWEKQNPDQKGILQFGAETKVTDFGAFRMGYELDDINKVNSVAAGAGFLGPKMKINYTVTKALKGATGAMHSVDLLLPF